MNSATSSAIDPVEFLNARVLVTGGSRGMGAAMVDRFLAGGARVATVARTKPDASPATLFVEADLRKAEGVRNVVGRIMRDWGGLDLLINNLGAAVWVRPDFSGLSDDYWQESLDGNLLAAVRLDRAFVPGMIERGNGVVLHIGAMTHRLVQPGCMIAYTTAKAALAAYSKGLSKSVGNSGVRINMISPGFILPGGSSATVEMIAAGQGISEDEATAAVVQQLGVPLGRPGRPEEVAELAAFLSSPRAAYIHGVDYMIDGGALPTT